MSIKKMVICTGLQNTIKSKADGMLGHHRLNHAGIDIANRFVIISCGEYMMHRVQMRWLPGYMIIFPSFDSRRARRAYTIERAWPSCYRRRHKHSITASHGLDAGILSLSQPIILQEADDPLY